MIAGWKRASCPQTAAMCHRRRVERRSALPLRDVGEAASEPLCGNAHRREIFAASAEIQAFRSAARMVDWESGSGGGVSDLLTLALQFEGRVTLIADVVETALGLAGINHVGRAALWAGD
jgi:hypothetical protein